MNLKKNVENHGKRNIIIIVLIDLKKGIKEDNIYLMKAKTFIQNTSLK